MNTLKQLAMNATKIVCVAYTDQFSINNKSILDLEVGCKHNIVSSNQDVLNRIESGNLVIVTSQCRHFVIGIVGKHIEGCTTWQNEGGHIFKYAREFTPLTDVLSIATIMGQWKATCEILEVEKDPKHLFHSRFCGYGTWYMSALHSAIHFGVIPILE